VESWALQGDGRTLLRRHRTRDYTWRDGIFQGELTGVFHTGAFRHTLLIGAEYEDSRRREILNRSGNAMPIDIFNPVYGQPRAPLTVFSDATTKVNSHALFIQDQIDLTQKLKLIVGGRYDHFDQSVTNNRTGGVQDNSFGAFSPRAGAIYQLTPEIGLFANVARSFRPNTGLGRTGSAFDPERGLGYEAGVKLDLFDQRLSVTAAAFHITKDNVLTADPVDPSFSIAAGRARSRGFDVSVVGQITPEWRVIGGYAFVDAEVLRDNTIRQGAPLVNAPRHSAGLLAVHEFQYGTFKGLGLGAGVKYVGSRAGDGIGTGFRLPAYITVDMLAYYQLTENVRLKVNVHNLFDREHYERSFDNRWVSPGAPRSVVGSLSVKF
jgi:iron complex outermembrane recepter protein